MVVIVSGGSVHGNNMRNKITVSLLNMTTTHLLAKTWSTQIAWPACNLWISYCIRSSCIIWIFYCELDVASHFKSWDLINFLHPNTAATMPSLRMFCGEEACMMSLKYASRSILEEVFIICGSVMSIERKIFAAAMFYEPPKLHLSCIYAFCSRTVTHTNWLCKR